MNLFDLLSYPITGPINGVIWVMKQLYDKAYTELYDPEKLKMELIQLRIQLERRLLSEEDYQERSKDIWERLNILKEEPEGDDDDGSATDEG